tara:strand:+ start:70083 stop:71666 length:1584 start_codon:yes stop_codon:yes gene_type:complete
MPRITTRERQKAKQAGRRPRYLCTWTDEHGKRCQRLAFTDKNAATRFELDQRERSRAIKTGLIQPEQEAIHEHSTTCISTHLKSFEQQLALVGIGNGRRSKPSEKYVQGVIENVVRFIQWTGPRFPKPVNTLREITLERSIAWADDLETHGWTTPTGKQKPYSGHSINAFIRNLTMFTAWAERTKRVSSDPLKDLGTRRTSNLHNQRTHVRRSITPDQFANLLEAAEARPLIAAKTINRGPRKGQLGAKITEDRIPFLVAKGKERATLYLTLFWTGLRRSEAKSLQWGDLVLNSEQPLLRLRGHTTKAKRSDVLALHTELVTRLAELKAARDPDVCDSDPVFSTIPNRNTFKKDLEAAGIDAVENDRHFDMHAIRVSLTTFLASQGVGQRIAQAHMRHTDPKLTAMTYTDAEALPIAAAINTLPSISQNKILEQEANQPSVGSERVSDEENPAAHRPLLRGGLGQYEASPVTNCDHKKTEEASRKPLTGHDLSSSVIIRETGFEPATFWSQTRRSTKLSYTLRWSVV